MQFERKPMTEPFVDTQKLPLEAYKLLVGLLQQEETFIWRRSEFFIVVNGALFSALGLILPKDDMSGPFSLRLVPIVICAVGVILCLLWLFTTARGEAFFNYWEEHLKYLEHDFLSPISIFQDVDKYFSKKRIKLGKAKPLKLPFLARLLKITRALEVSSSIFGVVWLILGVYLFIR
jgi:hypothetical protein